MQDFFIGKKNKKIEKKALALGLEIVFLKKVSNVEELDIKKDSKDYDAILIKTQDTGMMRRLIDKTSNFFKFIIILGTNDEINRACLEHKKTIALLSPEYSRRKDFINYRNSGLNQVLCKIARDNKKTIIESFSSILNADKKNKAIILGRIIQNEKLCRKYNVKFILRNMAIDEKEMKSAHELKNSQQILSNTTILK